jgi:hypothetical protein
MQQIDNPFRILFKNKLGLARIAPNAICHNCHMKEIYNLKNFYDNQLQAKITNFILQTNDQEVLGSITHIRLLNI